MRRKRAVQAGAETRAIGYVRVSTAEQARSGLGLGAQEERIKAYAAMAGLELADIIREESVSGAVPLAERPAGTVLLERLRSGEIRHLVALKLDRLFRDAADCLGQTRTWDRQGIALHFLDLGGQALNTSSAMGRLFLTMSAAFAELERNVIGERTAQALAEKRRRGEKCGGDTPYGFALGPDGRILVPVAREQGASAWPASSRPKGSRSAASAQRSPRLATRPAAAAGTPTPSCASSAGLKRVSAAV